MLPIKILETKLQPPTPVRTHVLRSLLVDRLAGAQARLLLVQAPAGFGKSTLMGQAVQKMEAAGMATAWLTLDDADNDVSRLVSALGEALLRLGHEGPPSLAPFDTVAAFASLDGPFVLVLDDFELMRDPGTLGLVREVIERLPPRGRVMIGTRTLPELGLARLRARGELLEVGAEQLRFDLSDTKAFFSQRSGRSLDTDTLSTLHRKTEGWVAALWLASLAFEREGAEAEFVERFSGSERSVEDYLADEVLSAQPPRVRDFLLRTSVLRQLDLSVCQVLCPRLDCGAILDELERGHLFLTPVNGPSGLASPAGDERAWRFHSLFAGFLRGQLARQHPELVPRLHLVASGWYEAQGRPVPAIDHAIEGGDHPLALDLLETHAERFLEQGRMRLLSRWFAQIPEERLREHPMLEVIYAWAMCFTQGPWAAMEMLERCGAYTSTLPDVQASARALHPLLLAMQDRFDEGFQAGSEAMAQHTAPRMRFAQAALLNAVAACLSVVGDPRESQRLIENARQQQGERSIFNRMYSESLEGIHDLHEARLRQATARFRLAVDATHVVTYNHSHGNAWAGVLFASVNYEANRLREAERLLNVYQPLVKGVGFADQMNVSYTLRSRLAFIEGDVDTAFGSLDALEVLGMSRKLPRVVAAARVERSFLLLRQGHAAPARDELVRADDPTIWDRERRQRLLGHDTDYLQLARLRWELHFGDARTALQGLAAEIATAARGSRLRRLLKLRLLHAVALQRLGEVSSAVKELTPVLEACCREGFVRLIVDEGPIVAPLLARCRDLLLEAPAAGVSPLGATSSDPILADYLSRLLDVLGPVADAGEAPAEPIVLAEPLTPKEIRVLELLAEGYSNSAMAEKLFLSDSTVRTHLRNINTKLGTKSRTQALASARRLGVIR